MIPHTATPAPMAVTTVLSAVTLVVKKAIFSETKNADFRFFVVFCFYRQNPNIKRAEFCRKIRLFLTAFLVILLLNL